MTAFFIAGLGVGMGILASDVKAQQPQQAPSSEQLDATLQTFKDMPPEERQQIMGIAMESFKNMPPEERQKLIEQAKSQASTLSDAQKKAYENQWQNVMTPEQKQMLMGQLQNQGVTPQNTAAPAAPQNTTAPAPAPAQNNTANLMQQINSLPPEQRQKLLEQLKGANTGAQ